VHASNVSFKVHLFETSFFFRNNAFSRDKFTIHSKAVVCQDVELKGDITISSGTIVHPKATIFAIAGPIVIGANCIIEEAAIIVNRCGCMRAHA
jgi:carbonic anhydrase/acetyltransferase-like protein (isoleucine patch superfamily)